MSFEEFKKKQKSIYDKFRVAGDLKTGIKPKILRGQSGYLISLRHSAEITDKLSEFSEKVNKIIPSVIYNTDNCHTTLSDYNVTSKKFIDKDILVQLITTGAEANNYKPIVIDYTKWLTNDNTLIAKGKPNKNFYTLANRVVNKGLDNNLELNHPWGAYITTNRYLEFACAEQIAELKYLINSTEPLGKSKPEYMDISYMDFTEDDKFDLFMLARLVI